MLIDSEKLKEKISGLFTPNAYTSFEEKQFMERYGVIVENAIYFAERDAKRDAKDKRINDVLDEIRTEITEEETECPGSDDYFVGMKHGLKYACKIIDRHRK